MGHNLAVKTKLVTTTSGGDTEHDATIAAPMMATAETQRLSRYHGRALHQVDVTHEQLHQ